MKLLPVNSDSLIDRFIWEYVFIIINNHKYWPWNYIIHSSITNRFN